uniref:Cysteine dioxygenase n=1 Tax=Ditylum brightwellii TaxID=49249 RepID=A0A7S1ZIA8_9STRA
MVIDRPKVIFLLLVTLLHFISSVSSSELLEGLELRSIEAAGVTLYKTHEPINSGPVSPDFPGTLPVSFIREALGIDVLSTAGFQRLLNDVEQCDLNRNETESESDTKSREKEFGKMMLARARAMFQEEECEHELDELLTTGLSNDGLRRMHWVVIDMYPNNSFALHSHPNMEFVYIVEGTLWEWRLVDKSVEKKQQYEPEEITVGGETHLRVIGPNLSSVDAQGGTFEKKAYNEGEMFINTIGAVHQSFTQSEGAKLFALWGDGNADVPPEQMPKNSDFFNDQSAKAWE